MCSSPLQRRIVEAKKYFSPGVFLYYPISRRAESEKEVLFYCGDTPHLKNRKG